jgi:hypothetical protein
MYRRKILCAAAISFAATAFASEPSLVLDGTWTKLAENVYQTTNPDGSTTRLAWGNGGAKYERLLVSREILEVSNRVANGNVDEVDHLANLKKKLDYIPLSAQDPDQIETATSGIICGRYKYDLDAQFAVGKMGATAIARSEVGIDGVAPPPPNPTSSSLYNESKIMPYGGTAIDVVTSNSGAGFVTAPPTAIVDWQKLSYRDIFLSDCSGMENAAVNVTGGNCTGPGLPGFISVTNNQSTCASSL